MGSFRSLEVLERKPQLTPAEGRALCRALRQAFEGLEFWCESSSEPHFYIEKAMAELDAVTANRRTG